MSSPTLITSDILLALEPVRPLIIYVEDEFYDAKDPFPSTLLMSESNEEFISYPNLRNDVSDYTDDD